MIIYDRSMRESGMNVKKDMDLAKRFCQTVISTRVSTRTENDTATALTCKYTLHTAASLVYE